MTFFVEEVFALEWQAECPRQEKKCICMWGFWSVVNKVEIGYKMRLEIMVGM